MSTWTVLFVVVYGVLFNNVDDVVAQPLLKSLQNTTAPQSPHEIMTVASADYQLPNPVNQEQPSQYQEQEQPSANSTNTISQGPSLTYYTFQYSGPNTTSKRRVDEVQSTETRQQNLHQPITLSANAINQVPSAIYQMPPYSTPSATIKSTVDGVRYSDYRQQEYLQPSTENASTGSTSTVNLESSAEYYQQDLHEPSTLNANTISQVPSLKYHAMLLYPRPSATSKSTVDGVLSSEYLQHEYLQPSIESASTKSTSTISQVPSLKYHNMLLYPGPSATSKSTVDGVRSSVYHQDEYLQPNTESASTESASTVNLESSAGYHQQDLPELSSLSANTISQVPSLKYHNMPLYPRPGATSKSTVGGVLSSEYLQHEYLQPSRDSDSTDGTSTVNQETSAELHHYENDAYMENFSTEKSLIQQPERKPDVVRFQRYHHPEPQSNLAVLSEFEEEDIQTQQPLLKNNFQPEKPGNHLFKNDIVPAEPSQATSTPNETAKYENLQNSHPPTPYTYITNFLPIHLRNYPILYPGNPDNYLQIGSRLYLNPEVHTDLYSVTDHSIHDSVVLAEAKAAARIQQLRA